MQIEELKQAAEQGDAKSQFLLGRHFFAGHLLPQDFTKAMHWYQKAADQNCAEALLDLGKMHEKGQGGAVDMSKAIDCYKRAADLDEPEAQYMVGLHFQLGQGVSRDDRQALHWFKRAAESQYPNAQFMLATIYSAGAGVEQDEKEAAKWYRAAAENGYAPAQYQIATVEEKFSMPVAEQWYQKAADLDFAPAQLRLGQLKLGSDRTAALAHYTGVAYHINELLIDGYLDSPEKEMESCLRAAQDACGDLSHDEAAQWAKLANMIAAQTGRRAPDMTPLLVDIARNLQHAGYYEEAEGIFVEALSTLRDGRNEELCAELFGRLGQMYAARDDLHKAEQTLREAVSSYETLGIENEQFADLLLALSIVYIKLDKQTLAVPLLRRCATLTENYFGSGSSMLSQVLSILAAACLSTGFMLLEAEQVYQRVLKIFDDNGKGSSAEAATVMDILASLMDHQERPEEAQQMRDRAASIKARQ